MSDYSDLIILMGAIVIFMLLGLQANRYMLNNSATTTHSEVEYYALIVNQEIVENIRVISDESAFHSYVSSFPTTVNYQTRIADLNFIPFEVTVATQQMHEAHATFEDVSDISSYHITVTVTSEFLNNGAGGSVSLSTAKSFLSI